MKKRVLSTLLALVMLLGLLPTAAWAEAAPQANNIASGDGWVLDADGKLTISSDKGMEDWPSSGNTHKGSVKSAEIQSGVTSIGRSAFNGCTALASITIPESVASIGDFAFNKCTALASITIPAIVTSIGNYAFWNCTALTNITIPEDAKVTTIGQSAFSGCSNLKSITIPKNVTSIGNEAFYRCTALASITIPENAQVTTIGASTFSECSSLTSITIPGSVTSIGNSAFYYCTALASITIPENAKVTSIGENVFSFCISLTSITIPKNVTEIKSSAFYRCTGLTTVTMLPETPPTVADGAFSDCKFSKEQTTGIHVPEGKAEAYKSAWSALANYITDGTQTSDHNHPVCGNDCGHNGAHEVVPWKALNQDSFTGGENGKPKAGSGVTLESGQYKLAEGHYYLAGSVNLDKKIYINSSTVDLCLNGHTLTSEIVANSGIQNAIEVSYNATLNLCDCQGGGKFTSNALYTLEIKESAASFANLYGGTVDNPTGICAETRGNLVLDGATLKAGGDYVINAQSTSAVIIKSGKVEGSRTKCVQMTSKATFAMTDGTVTNTGSGCGVSMSNLGGTISGGTIHSNNGVGIDLASYSITLSGNPTITGREASIGLSTNGAITVGEGLEGTYSVLHANWRSKITERTPFAFTTAASSDHSEHFTAATKMTGIAVRNSGTGSSQQVQLYMPHNWSSGWTKNTTHHWHVCHNSAEGNCAISDYAACGEEGAAYGAHQWVYETNPTQHRQKCTVCSYTENSWTPHTWTDDHDLDCNDCGYQRSVPLYGTVTVTGTPKLGVPLTAAVTGAPEGVTLKYAWTAAGSDTVLGTASTYTPTADQVGKTLTVTVTTEDARYTGSLTAATAAVDKGDQTAPVGIFTITDAAYGQTTGTIAVQGDATKLEYRLKPADGSEPVWINASSSNTLPAGTYEFRYKETSTHYASHATEVQIRILAADAKSLTIDPAIEHGTVTKRRDSVNPGDQVTLAVKPDDGYELATLTANYNDGEAKTITPTVKPDNAQQYTFQMPNADVTVTATFSPITYTIDYQWEGVADGSFTVETAGLTLAAPTRTGYTLSGWAFAEGGTAIENVTAAALMEKAVGRTVTLYPVWVEGETPPSHTHAWATAWSHSATHHWHECNAQGCDVTQDSGKNGYAEHTKAWVKIDAAQHWRTCATCGWTGEKTAHVYDNEQDATCNTCGYTRTVTPPTPDEGKVKGEVETKPGAPKVEVDEEALKELAGTPVEGKTITVKLIVEKKNENAVGAAEIKRAASGKTVEFLDMSLLKMTVQGGSTSATEPITDTNGKVLEIEVSYDFSGKKDVIVYRYHDGKAEALTKADTKAGGTFMLTVDSVIIYATKFSTYAIGYTPEGGGWSGPTTYPVETPNADGGKVTVSPKSAASGTTVTLTLTPDQGYTISGVTVTDRNGKQITVTNKGDGKYTFTMPSGKVTVTGAFAKIMGGYKDCPRDSTCPIWPYTDTNLAAWYHDGIHFCVENGLMNGYGNGKFGPNDNLTRAQFAQILHNREGRPVVNYLLRFEDVPNGAWYTEAVRWAAAQGVVSGYSSGKFGPNDPITREQLAAMLWRYAGSPAAAEKELHFTDADKSSGYALEALRWAVENGIINGYGDGRLDPRGLATRAQVAQMLMNFLNNK